MIMSKSKFIKFIEEINFDYLEMSDLQLKNGDVHPLDDWTVYNKKIYKTDHNDDKLLINCELTLNR